MSQHQHYLKPCKESFYMCTMCIHATIKNDIVTIKQDMREL